MGQGRTERPVDALVAGSLVPREVAERLVLHQHFADRVCAVERRGHERLPEGLGDVGHRVDPDPVKAVQPQQPLHPLDQLGRHERAARRSARGGVVGAQRRRREGGEGWFDGGGVTGSRIWLIDARQGAARQTNTIAAINRSAAAAAVLSTNGK